ncbi:phosphohydrolase [Paraburkholderia sp. Ac-20347]|uniref:phosphohydrolase n=1 Tax=Paraburkholderia sp. Ac-20347 TaxID=2703892 RepID=UPI0019802DF0|nr:phosphohydrolase [Paraburkholderia sp. Ac-20347]MBN3810783.1 phosphohydrolase [Paraburkholderia sp. Ac-20347]
MGTASWRAGGEVAGVRIPCTPVAIAAAESAHASLPPVLLGHASRVFVFAALNARRGGVACDEGTLYVSSMYANMGLSAAYAHSTARYELDSADAARRLLHHYGASARDQDEAWLAIALHTTPGVSARVSPLADMLAAAVRTDLVAAQFDDYTGGERSGVLAAYPRGKGFEEEIIGAIGRGVAHRPHTTFGTASADVLDRVDPNYCRVNFCGQILGSRWQGAQAADGRTPLHSRAAPRA